MAKQLDIQKIVAEDFASKPEGAVYLEVSERTVDRWLQQGDGPPVTMIRKRVFFERKALAEFKRKRERAKAARQ